MNKQTPEENCLDIFTSGKITQVELPQLISGDGLTLRLEKGCGYGIYIEETRAGRLELRLSRDARAFYSGNIGYAVYPKYRGAHLAARACALTAPIFAMVNIPSPMIVCQTENEASKRVCAELGAILISERKPPADSCAAKNGFVSISIYRWDI